MSNLSYTRSIQNRQDLNNVVSFLIFVGVFTIFLSFTIDCPLICQDLNYPITAQNFGKVICLNLNIVNNTILTNVGTINANCIQKYNILYWFGYSVLTIGIILYFYVKFLTRRDQINITPIEEEPNIP